MTTDDAVAAFCEEYHNYNGISDGRRLMQERVIRKFVADVGAPADVDAQALRSYLGSLVGNYAASTIRKHHNALRPFFTWLWQQRLIDGGRLLELREVKPPRGNSMPKPRPYSRKEIAALWGDLDESYPWCRCGKCKPEDRHEHALWWLRRWRAGLSRWIRVQAYAERVQMEAIVAFALMGGLRRIEIFNLTVDRAHPENHYIVVAGAAKNRDAVSEDRPVPWGGGDDMRATVLRWIELRAEIAPAHQALWLSLYRERWAANAMAFDRFELLLSRIGSGYELHRLRHTFATETLRAGMPVERLSRILGHATVQQTMAYAELADVDLVKASERVQSNFTRAIARPV